MTLEQLLVKISTDVATDPAAQLGADTELLMSGLVDSIGVLTLVSWIEEALEVEIDPGDVTLENFQTPGSMIDFASSLTHA